MPQAISMGLRCYRAETILLGQRSFDFLQYPVIGCVHMAVIAIETVVKYMLEQTSALAAHDGIAQYGLEIAIG